jgi:hypothetical protein
MTYSKTEACALFDLKKVSYEFDLINKILEGTNSYRGHVHLTAKETNSIEVMFN